MTQICRITFKGLTQISLLSLSLMLISAGASSNERPPNIVLLIGDDHGYPYFGFMGDEHVVTPSMDALAEGGVTFSHTHVTAPYCRPSLRTLATGLHPVDYQKRVNDIVARRQAEDSTFETLEGKQRQLWLTAEKAAGMKAFNTLPKALKTNGYVSWQGGKWWERSYAFGHFDEGMTGGWTEEQFGDDDFFLELMGAEGNDLVRETMDPLYDFIDRHSEEPMFIWFGPSLPHTPFDAPYSFRKFYENKPISESAKRYYSNITWWDAGVGDLMDFMESRGLMENTVFVYISDNGWEQDANVEYWSPGTTYYNNSEYATGGLTGKGSLDDLSLRSPLIFYWKDRYTASFDEQHLISALDIYPTLLEIGGVAPDEPTEGVSLVPLLSGVGAAPDRDVMITYSDNRRTGDPMGGRAEGYALRTKRWHFYWYRDTGDMRLYDVTTDPRGESDLSQSRPNLVADFKAQIMAWREQKGITGYFPIYE